MKKTILFILAVFLVVTWGRAQTAEDFNVELTDDGLGVRIKGYTGKAVSVNIPAEIEGLPVREIGESAFGATGPLPLLPYLRGW